MKKAIDGKIYDTEKAELIGSYDAGLGTRDFRNFKEDLYRTKKGRWFLAGQGGPLTKYARRAGNNGWTNGSRIIPISEAEARAWCEHYMAVELTEKLFELEEA